MKRTVQITFAIASLGIMSVDAQSTSSAAAQSVVADALPDKGASQDEVSDSVAALVAKNPSFAVEIAAAAIAKFPSFELTIISAARNSVASSGNTLPGAVQAALKSGLSKLLSKSDSVLTLVATTITPFRSATNATLQILNTAKPTTSPAQ